MQVATYDADDDAAAWRPVAKEGNALRERELATGATTKAQAWFNFSIQINSKNCTVDPQFILWRCVMLLKRMAKGLQIFYHGRRQNHWCERRRTFLSHQ